MSRNRRRHNHILPGDMSDIPLEDWDAMGMVFDDSENIAADYADKQRLLREFREEDERDRIREAKLKRKNKHVPGTKRHTSDGTHRPVD